MGWHGGMAWIAWIRMQDSMACGMCIASGHRHVVGGVDGREAQSGPELSAGAAEIAMARELARWGTQLPPMEELVLACDSPGSI